MNWKPPPSRPINRQNRAQVKTMTACFLKVIHIWCRPTQTVLTGEKCIDMMTRQNVLDQYFMDARHKLIDIAAFLDRVESAEGKADFRLDAFRDAMKRLDDNGNDRAKDVLLAFSDPTPEPIAIAPGQGACGAWPGENV